MTPIAAATAVPKTSTMSGASGKSAQVRRARTGRRRIVAVVEAGGALELACATDPPDDSPARPETCDPTGPGSGVGAMLIRAS